MSRSAAVREKVSVVATVLNEAASVETMVAALLGQTRPPDEIVIVDAGSTDETVHCLRRINTGSIALHVEVAPGVSIAAGRNLAIERATGDIIACTDAGCIPDPTWLSCLVEPTADPSIDVVGGHYRIAHRSAFERVVGLVTMPGQLRPVDPLRFNPSARSLAFRRAAWTRARGFPEWLHTAEDTLFDCQLRRQGAAFAWAPSAIVRWRPRPNWGSVWRQFATYARGEAHLGRGGANAAFWTRRFLLAAALAAYGGAWSFVASTFWPLAVVIGAAVFLLAAPVHPRARAVAGFTWSGLDYVRGIGIGIWVAAATVWGHRQGRRDRLAHPERFVDQLVAYWGTDRVDAVPPWTMRSPPPPRTLVVSWHWPPTRRASTGVLHNLMCHASADQFQVITRGRVGDAGTDPLPALPLPTHHVAWPLRDERDGTWRTWAASIWTTWRMIRTARAVARDWPVERVLAVHPHRFGLLAGWLVARQLRMPLAAYMHDLLADTLATRSRIKRAFWTRIERRALRSAHLVAVPTREFADHYRYLGVGGTWVLPHCRSAEPGETVRPVRRSGDRLRLVYAGSIYQAHEGAIVALQAALGHVLDVEMTWLTRGSRVLPPGIGEWVERAEVARRVADADVAIVALGAHTPYPAEVHGCFPSKLVDYLVAGRPILAVVPRGCFVDRLIRSTGCGVSVTPRWPKLIAAGIDRLRAPSERSRMSDRARALADQLDGRKWMGLLAVRLALDPPVQPNQPGFPIPLLDTELASPVPESLPAGVSA